MQVEERWWETFFSDVTLDVWRRLRTDDNTRPEADFLERLGLPPGAHVLDVPCGGGRLCLELWARGHHATGVDLSEDFLLEAQAAAAERGAEVRWERRDMRDLPWDGEFDAACCFGISFGYLEGDGDAEFARAVCRALKPGGRFVIDTNKILEIVLPQFEKRRWAQVGDVLLLLENDYDHVNGRLNTEYTFIRNGTRVKRVASQRAYGYHELCELLKRAGFASCEGYGSLKGEPLKLGSQRLLLVATK